VARERALQLREKASARLSPPERHPGAAELGPSGGKDELRHPWGVPPDRSPPSPRSGGSPGIVGEAVPGPTLLERRKHPFGDRLPSGTPRLDDLLLGGLPPRSHIALVGDAFVGKEVVVYAFISEGLRRHEPAILITTTRTSHELSRALRAFLPGFEEHERDGRVAWIDASGSGLNDSPQRFATKGSDDMFGLSQALALASKRSVAVSPTGRFRVGFLGLSAVLAHSRERESLLALQNILGILRSHEALAMYAVEAGAVTEPQVESLLGRMDGAIIFRQERGRTFLSAKGFGGVATGDWIECRATDRGLVLGSFALERIR